MRDASEQITWIAVADGEKALLLCNDDTDALPFLNVIRVVEIDNPPTREQGMSCPGRYRDGGTGMQHRSGFEQTDWHQLGKERFAKDFIDRLNRAALKNAFDRLFLFAPPQVLGLMRAEYHTELEKRIVKEVGSDLTKHPVDEIEKHYSKALTP